MKRKMTTLTVAAAMILGCGCVALATTAGKAKRNAVPQNITIFYGDVPVSLTGDAFQTAFDPAVLAH